MGCCLSTQNETRLSKAQSLAKNGGNNKKAPLSPPPPPPSTEVVKEVLSETPKPRTIINSQEPDDPIPQKPIFDHQIPKRPQLSPQQQQQHNIALKNQTLLSPTATAEVSEEVSEICSVSESVSTTTTTNTTNFTDEVGSFSNHYSMSNRNRSPLKKQQSNPTRYVDPGGGRRDNGVGKSPVRRRIEQSPGRVNGGSVRMVQSRDPSPGVVRRGARSDPNRRDPGEMSGRRSRSPATRVDNGGSVSVGRSPSGRRTNPSPGRVRSGPPERGRSDQSGDNFGEESKRVNGGGDESLDNPLVSLECFIFL